MLATASAAGAAAWPLAASAQLGTIKLATLVPMTGGGSQYGPLMHKAAGLVVTEANAAGGVLGMRLELLTEDDQTNPEAGVRAARKLIDVDKVSALLGLWSSGVTSAVAPLAWESKTFLACVSGADSITLLPHQGYLIRTQPTTTLQGRRFAEFAQELGAKRVVYMGPQTPYTDAMIGHVKGRLQAAKVDTSSIVYEEKKVSYRSEVDQAMRGKPDLIILGGFVADTAILLKDLYRAGFKGRVAGVAFGINSKLLEAVPAEVVEGIYTIAPSPGVGSPSYKRLASLMGINDVDTYTCQTYDQTALVILAMAQAKQTSGTAIRDNVRKVGGPGGKVVTSVAEGLKLIAAGQQVDYEGAGGSCQFDANGDIQESAFRYEQVKAGKLVLLKIA